MTPSFVDESRRLLLRYAQQDMPTVNFNQVRTNAAAGAMYDLANAVGTIQAAKPNKVSTMLTKRIVLGP